MVDKQTAKFLGFRYKFLAAIFILLAGGLVLLPKYKKNEGIAPEKLLSHIISSERYISTDEVATKIIAQDPSFILVDLRDEQSFEKYSLPNAVNIPLQKLLNKDSEGLLNQDQFDIIFFSNDHFYADQAWMLCTRLGYKNLKVLEGGLNRWFETIINPPLPDPNMPEEAIKLYNQRKASSMSFGVNYTDQIQVSQKKEEPKKVQTFKKKKKTAEGGC
ncbi:MAG: rhodanese-like domain-containing protein [Flavobacteriales bacterium]|nr:rhodanese-like domain-containing protein [Flavobacteriales bacterium]